MSCVFVLTPVIGVVAWPVFCAIAAAALAEAGYVAVATRETAGEAITAVDVELERSQALAESLKRDQTLTFRQDDVVVTLYKDPRGRLSLHVEGRSRSKQELEEIGRELTRRITQRFVHERLKDELGARGFSIVAEETQADRSIHLTVRKWR